LGPLNPQRAHDKPAPLMTLNLSDIVVGSK